MKTPKRLGRYELHHRLGEGGMGEVYLATSKGAHGFEKLVALKCLRPEYTKDPERTRGLLREAMLGVSLDHEHIVQVHDLGDENGVYFLAMEYVRGHSVAHVMKLLSDAGKTMPVIAAVQVARALSRALEYVHGFRDSDGESLRLIHGDVSPGNVLLAHDGRIKLTDFGVAAIGETSGERGRLVGKIAYLPPEAATGTPREQSWDVYASAAVLFVALGGASDMRRAREAVRQVRKQGAAACLGRDDVSDGLATVLDLALSARPERRFQTAGEFRHALDRALPRTVVDHDAYREWLTELFGSDPFVRSTPDIPTTGSGFDENGPFLAETAQAEVSTINVKQARPIRFGLSPAMGPDVAREMGGRLAKSLRAQLGRDVVPVILGDYQALVDCLANGDVDIAWMPPVSYLQAWERGAGVLVVAVREGGVAYQSALAVAVDSPIQTLEDLKGKSAAWVNRDSASGYLFAAARIVEELGPLDQVLGKQHFLGSHRSVCEAVANGWADVCATYINLDGDTVASSGWNDYLGEPQALRPIALSEPIPSDNIAHCPNFPAAVARELSQAFAGLSDTAEGRELLSEVFNAQGFVAVEQDLYDAMATSIKKIDG